MKANNDKDCYYLAFQFKYRHSQTKNANSMRVVPLLITYAPNDAPSRVRMRTAWAADEVKKKFRFEGITFHAVQSEDLEYAEIASRCIIFDQSLLIDEQGKAVTNTQKVDARPLVFQDGIWEHISCSTSITNKHTKFTPNDRTNQVSSSSSSSSSKFTGFDFSTNTSTSPLTVMTYNIWFDSFAYKERAHQVLKFIEQHYPHVVGLQEVTARFIAIVMESKFIQHHYTLSGDKSSLSNYGVLMLVRKRQFGEPLLNANKQPIVELLPARWGWIEFPSRMGRKLLQAVFEVRTSDSAAHQLFCIGAVHLESLSSSRTRNHQLKIIERAQREAPFAIVMGDFNFDSDRNFYEDVVPLENDEMKKVLSNYIDCWPTVHPNTPGKTRDTKKNKMIADHSPENFRLDRVMFKSPSSSSLKPQSMQILGDESFESSLLTSLPIYPSDHFGLLCSFGFNNSTTTTTTSSSSAMTD
eukprot:CAMPEP_0201548934 /NCGR_PEP_ID=MMETSP0173_2-20130828/5434_1 /ASSEMBLY_ACC=CAM_ASM_000268 /TAXON_ID=218659 /ORGANISM="Vexillifera sp., Strain DIVA3 564/2" /LENGTH=467 /DNA_ID=CAMNT_0047958455 /DNA_START=235 /DNA_END=1638 /DNA_ORIENTATION=-